MAAADAGAETVPRWPSGSLDHEVAPWSELTRQFYWTSLCTPYMHEAIARDIYPSLAKLSPTRGARLDWAREICSEALAPGA